MTGRAEELPELLARIPDPEIRALFSHEFILCSEEFDRFTVETLQPGCAFVVGYLGRPRGPPLRSNRQP